MHVYLLDLLKTLPDGRTLLLPDGQCKLAASSARAARRPNRRRLGLPSDGPQSMHLTFHCQLGVFTHRMADSIEGRQCCFCCILSSAACV